jgi:hypothetical protein
MNSETVTVTPLGFLGTLETGGPFADSLTLAASKAK